MRVSIFLVSALISFGLFSITLPAIAATQDVNEASVFFEEVISNTDNPIIAAFAKESLNKIKNNTPVVKEANIKEIKEVIASTSSSSKQIETQFANFSTTGAIVKPVYGKKLPMVDPEAVEVPLIKGSYASNLVVPATLNRNVTGTFIVDTGATYTVITPALARELGVNTTKNTQKIAILTANGWIQAPIITLNHLSIGDVEVSGIQAVVQDLGGDANLNGLLGMNFFKDIELTIKRDKLVLRIGSSDF